MIPVIHSAWVKPSNVNYDSNGLGSLTDTISCTVVEELNGEFELTLVYPQNGIHAQDIENRKIITAIPSPYRIPEAFRIYSIERNIEGLMTVHAHHISYELSLVPVTPFGANGTLNALQGLLDNSLVDLGFTVETDLTSKAHFEITHPQAFRTCLAGVEGSILDVFGGEYTFERSKIILNKKRGRKGYVTIAYGKNLTNYDREENGESLVTGVYPFWIDSNGENLVVLPEQIVPIYDATSSVSVVLKATNGDVLMDTQTVGGSTAHLRLAVHPAFGFDNIVTLDCTEYFEEMPTEGQLRERAKQYISENGLGAEIISVAASYVQLDKSSEYESFYTALEAVDLGDTVKLQYQIFDDRMEEEETRVTRIETDVLREIYTDVTIGARRVDIADTVSYILRKGQSKVNKPMYTLRPPYSAEVHTF